MMMELSYQSMKVAHQAREAVSEYVVLFLVYSIRFNVQLLALMLERRNSCLCNCTNLVCLLHVSRVRLTKCILHKCQLNCHKYKLSALTLAGELTRLVLHPELQSVGVHWLPRNQVRWLFVLVCLFQHIIMFSYV